MVLVNTFVSNDALLRTAPTPWGPWVFCFLLVVFVCVFDLSRAFLLSIYHLCVWVGSTCDMMMRAFFVCFRAW
jgi:hypothetical protein